MASEDRGLYRLRTASDAPYLGAYGYGRRESFGQKLTAALTVVVRVAIGVAVLLACVAGIYLYRDTPVALFADSSRWLTASHLLVPVGFFCVFLTNRRYGPAYAFAQVVVTAIVIVGFLLAVGGALNEFLPLDTIPPVREAAAFGAAFFVASFVSTVAFDGARGPHWWTAPLFGYLSAAIIYPALFFAVLLAGSDPSWMYRALEYAGLIAGEGLLLLIPFWLLRRMVPPLSGFGGY